MAAPSGIVWGSQVDATGTGGGRIGIYTGVSSTNTETTLTVEIWFWAKWTVDDAINVLRFDNLSSSGKATTSKGAVRVITTEPNYSWSTTNQVKIATYTYNYTRGTSAVKRYLYASLADIDVVPGTMYASTTVSIPKLASYTISYNANGGSGAPSAQTKYYGKTLTLSTSKPTRTGYTFQGWATSSTGAKAYNAGASYTANAGATLYAVWTANTYTISYNANGGSGAPSAQTKTYGVTLKLSTTKPTKTNYNFLGWATSSSATSAQYASGANYTANGNATLYAVWELAYTKPRITNLSISRCNSSGSLTEEGTYALVKFNWACDETISSITIRWKTATATSWTSSSVTASGTSGAVNTVVGSNGLNNELIYSFQIEVRDSVGYSTQNATLNGIRFTVDFLAGGNGVAFGKAATVDGAMDIYMRTIVRGSEDASGTTESGQFIVGDPNGYHLAMDNNEIMAKNNATTPGNITINYEGGNVGLGNGDSKIAINGNAYMKNGNGLYFANSSGADRLLVQLNSSNQAVFGYGGYANNEGASCFDGNSVNIRSKGAIAITSPTAGLTARHYGVNKVLWSGAYFMTAGHTINLSESVSAQPNGISLVFSCYSSGAAQNYWFCDFFVPKAVVASHNGSGHEFILGTNTFGTVAGKYLYIHNDTITGADTNDDTGTASGISYKNNQFVLRYVIGV